MAQPPAYVAPPAITPAGFGLFSVAQMPAEPGQRWESGVEYQPDSATPATAWVDDCPPTSTPTGPTSTDAAGATGASTPGFTVAYANYPDTYTVTVTVTDAPAAGNELRWGDGATQANIAAGSTYTHTYTAGGTYTITAADVAGGAVNIATADVTVPWDSGPIVKTVTPAGALVTGSPFTVYAGADCAPGRSLQAIQDRARRALELGEQRAVEHAYWAGALGNRPRLADPSVTDLSGGAAVSLLDGLAALEQHVANTYPGVGTIHAPRRVGTYAAHDMVVSPAGGRMTSPLGTKVAFGTGYDNTGPDGTAAADGTAWLYVTGEVVIRRSDVFYTPPEPSRGLNLRTNEVMLLAERTYVITHEGEPAAVLVNLA